MRDLTVRAFVGVSSFEVGEVNGHGGTHQKLAKNAKAARVCTPAALFQQQKRLGALYVVSPYTVTVISETTSVCNEMVTVLSPVTLIGPWGMRTWAFTIL